MSRRVFSKAFATLLLTALAAAHAGAWDRLHSDGPNSGFADVDTLAAERPATVAGLGSFAPGTGPVIAADGTFYLGNLQGQLMSFKPDGTRGWTQNVDAGFSIVAPPVVDSQGSVYVVGTRTVKNQQTNPPLVRSDSSMYKFTAAGTLAWKTAFPNGFEGPAVSAAPNIWRIPNEPDVVMALADRHNKLTGGYDTLLVAFSTDGAIIDSVNIKSVVYQAYGSSDVSLWCLVPPITLGCIFGSDFNPSGAPANYDPATLLPENTVSPRPGPAIFGFPSGGTPFILVSNQFQDLVAYTFANHGFHEIFRIHDENRLFLSPPMVLPDGHTVISTSGDDKKGKIIFAGPNMNALQPVTGPVTSTSATRLADGRMAIVERFRRMSILNGNHLERTVELPGESIVSAAASRNHVFVSTAGSFITYDPGTWLKLAEISWVGGGTVTPAIGPFGHVYAMASNILFVFPPPRPVTAGPLVANPDGPLVADPGPATAAPANAPASQRFGAPVTDAGHRLFACQELDGDDCGKSTNKTVALAFCQQKGFTAVDKVDTETRRVQAARMDGQFCRKNKCKVFDEIVCKN